MFEFAAFTYGILASYVLASISNNHKTARANSQVLTSFGWGLMAFSMTLSVLLSGWLLMRAIAGELPF